MCSKQNYLIEGKYSFEDLVDIDQLRRMFQRFSEATGFTTGLISYPDQKLLIGTGWRDICIKFHRAYPSSEIYCKQSNTELTECLKQRKELNISHCASGLVDGATPIIVKGIHVANLATGQILFKDPDLARFKKQGKAYGYNTDDYLEALKEVPVVSEEELKKALLFLSEMAVMLAEQGLTELRNRQTAQKAQESAEKLRITLNSIGDAVIATDIDSNVIHMNPVAEHLTGWSFKDALGQPLKNVFSIVHAKTGQCVDSPVKKVLTTGKVVGLANHTMLCSKDGTEYHISDSGAPIKDSLGTITGVVLVFRDVSEEYKLREQYRNMAFLVESSSTPIVMSNLKGELIHVNPAFLKTWGYTEATEVLGHPISEFWKVDERIHGIMKTMEKDGVMSEEAHARKRDGTVFDVQVSAAVVRNSSGEAVAMMSSSIDITKRKIVEKELRHLRNYLSEIINSMPSILIGIDTAGNISLWNKAAEEQLSLTEREAIGKNIKTILPHNYLNIDTVFKSIKSNVIEWETKKAIQTESGLRYVNATVFPLTFEEKTGAVIRIDDVTKETELEEQLNHSRKMDAIGQLAGGVAHDFNNMLSGIMNAAQLLTYPKMNLDEKGLKFVDIIQQSALQAANLTSKLLAFGRKQKYTFSIMDVHKTIDDTAAILNRTINKKIKLITEKNATSHLIQGDNTGLQNALLNIGINASHAMPTGGKLTIKTENTRLDTSYCKACSFDIEPGSFIKITINDTGSGIAPNDLNRIFEPFFTTKTPEQGTGLGLATAYGTVQEHHGEITVSSKLGKGSSFHIMLPCSDDTNKTSYSSKKRAKGSGLILLVDDEDSVRFTAKCILEELGYTVLEAKSGQIAINIFKEKHKKIAAIILDMIMPEMDGQETAAKLREIDQTCQIIISSGFTKSKHLDELEQLNICGFIQKPYTDIDLSQLLAQVLQG